MMKRKMFVFIQLCLIGLLFTTINSCKKKDVTTPIDVVIAWENPADITSGTALSATQLNASAGVEGTFVYTPAIGTILSVGVAQNLKVDFTPTDAANYNSATKTVTINVIPPLAIGDSYQGGRIAYIFQPPTLLFIGDPGYVAGETHGLIAATIDQSASRWYNGTYSTTGATGTALGTGSANTTAIIGIQGNVAYAAKICRDYAGGGYNDWYLPSKDELNKLYLNRVAIGGFSVNSYWSSTEVSDSSAYFQFFGSGYQDFDDKSLTFRVRAVRAF